MPDLMTEFGTTARDALARILTKDIYEGACAGTGAGRKALNDAWVVALAEMGIYRWHPTWVDTTDGWKLFIHRPWSPTMGACGSYLHAVAPSYDAWLDIADWLVHCLDTMQDGFLLGNQNCD